MMNKMIITLKSSTIHKKSWAIIVADHAIRTKNIIEVATTAATTTP
jgi:hypothetical protein